MKKAIYASCLISGVNRIPGERSVVRGWPAFGLFGPFRSFAHQWMEGFLYLFLFAVLFAGSMAKAQNGFQIALLSPNSGSGSEQVFTVTYRDIYGISDITGLYFNVSTPVWPSAYNSCHLFYDPVQKNIALMGDPIIL